MSAITAIRNSPRSTRMASSTFPVGYSYCFCPDGAGRVDFRNNQLNKPIGAPPVAERSGGAAGRPAALYTEGPGAAPSSAAVCSACSPRSRFFPRFPPVEKSAPKLGPRLRRLLERRDRGTGKPTLHVIGQGDGRD